MCEAFFELFKDEIAAKVATAEDAIRTENENKIREIEARVRTETEARIKSEAEVKLLMKQIEELKRRLS